MIESMIAFIWKGHTKSKKEKKYVYICENQFLHRLFYYPWKKVSFQYWFWYVNCIVILYPFSFRAQGFCCMQMCIHLSMYFWYWSIPKAIYFYIILFSFISWNHIISYMVILYLMHKLYLHIRHFWQKSYKKDRGCRKVFDGSFWC